MLLGAGSGVYDCQAWVFDGTAVLVVDDRGEPVQELSTVSWRQFGDVRERRPESAGTVGGQGLVPCEDVHGDVVEPAAGGQPLPPQVGVEGVPVAAAIAGFGWE